MVPLMGLPLVPMTVSWLADTKLFVRGTTATRKRHSAQSDVPPRSGRVLTLKGHSINLLANGRAVGFSVPGLGRSWPTRDSRSPRRATADAVTVPDVEEH